ncbi:MAG: PHP domain-containing protein [Clostridia bacterium]|nr:PHP domain-containing protein [Clostridia bacterium]
MQNDKKYFKTELHCHSKDASPCSTESAQSLVEIYQKAGYDTVVITNHYSHYVYDHYGCKNIGEYVDIFMRGVENMQSAAKGKLTVIFGMELRMKDTPNDYLCFGVTEEFLRNTPNIFDLTYHEFFNICEQKGWLFIQAHPFRKGILIVDPAYIHGMEVYNGHIGHQARNFIAKQWAEEYGLIQTSGTDLHYSYVPASGGILTKEKITSIEQLVKVLKSRDYQLLQSDKCR